MTASVGQPQPAPRLYEGWKVVIAAGTIVFLVASSFFYGFGAIFTSVREEFGWSAAATSIAFSVRSEVGGLASPLVGYAIDRWGAQRAMVIGVLLMALGVFVISIMQNLWQFYLAMFITALGTTAAGGQVAQAAIATWFRRKRARAMSLMTVGAGFGGILVTGVAYLVEELGWRSALQVLTVIILVLGTTAARFVRSRPRDFPQPMDGIPLAEGEVEVRDDWGIPAMVAIRTRAFALLSLTIVLAQIGSVAFVIHQIPYMEVTLGVSKTTAGATVTMFALTSITGRLLAGQLADRFDKRHILALSLALMSTGLTGLALASELWHAVIAILIFAQGYGGLVPVRPAMMADYFGVRHFGQINGWGRLLFTTGGAIGGWLVGFLFDVTAGYTVAWFLAAAFIAAGIPFILAARPPTELIERYRREAEEAHERELAEGASSA